jgi:hypothetical protein
MVDAFNSQGLPIEERSRAVYLTRALKRDGAPTVQAVARSLLGGPFRAGDVRLGLQPGHTGRGALERRKK